MVKTIEQMYNEKQKRIDRAINAKEKSIAYMNSVNAAIARCPEGSLEEILEWRDKFYSAWQDWYMTNMPLPEMSYREIDARDGQGEARRQETEPQLRRETLEEI
jgi:hypothetical protein